MPASTQPHSSPGDVFGDLVAQGEGVWKYLFVAQFLDEIQFANANQLDPTS